jgi:hypothetical protein
MNWRKGKAHLGVFLRGKLFDWRYGVETTGIVPISALSVLGGNAAQAIQYEPVSPDELAKALAAVNVRFSEYTFIDFGSGKGRVLLMASRYPFRRIIGVEFGAELHRVAERNIAAFRGPQQCRDIRTVHCDATQFPIPQEPLVIFFNNPFRDPVMGQVMSNIAASLEGAPRSAVFVTVTRWTVRGHIERLPGIHIVKQEPAFTLYETNPAGQIEIACHPKLTI